MRKLVNHVTLHINVPKEVAEAFDTAYPDCRRRFVTNAMILAQNDRNFFDKIFFKDIIKRHDTDCNYII